MTARGPIVALLVVILSVLPGSCRAQPGPPYGLDSIELPEGSEAIAAVLSKMPDRLEGRVANEVAAEEHMVSFSYGSGHELAIAATDWGLGEGDFPPWTNEEMLPRFVESGEVEVAESVLEGKLLWLTGTNSSVSGDVTRTFWTMWFGALSSHWTFSISADSRQEGIALVEAFVEAASQDV